jgi:hypothetical protein
MAMTEDARIDFLISRYPFWMDHQDRRRRECCRTAFGDPSPAIIAPETAALEKIFMLCGFRRPD